MVMDLPREYDDLPLEYEAYKEYLPRRIKKKRLTFVLAAGVVLCVGLVLLYRHQVAKAPDAFLRQAHQAEREEQLALAVDYLQQYLELVPDDTEEWDRYTGLLEKVARGRLWRLDVFYTHERAVRNHPEAERIRRRCARLAVELGLWRDADHHLTRLIKDAPRDPELLRLQARCEVGQGAQREAAVLYARVVTLAPDDLDSWEIYLYLAGKLELKGEAEPARIVSRMLQANPKLVPARLVAARYYLRLGQLDSAAREVHEARQKLGGQQEELFQLDAEIALRQGKPEQAIAHLRAGLKRHPDAVTLRLQAVRLEIAAGRHDVARAVLDSLRGARTAQTEQLWELGRLAIEMGAGKVSEEVRRRLRGRLGSTWATEMLRAARFIHDRRWGEARLILEKIRERRVPTPELLCQAEVMLADCYQALGNPDQQILAARRALLEDRSSVAARLRLAAGLAALGDLDAGISEYAAIAGRVVDARLLLARLQTLRQLTSTEGEKGWKKVDQTLATLTPAQANSLEGALLRSEVAMLRGRFDDARNLALKARDRAPKDAGAWLMLADVARRQEKPDEALAIIETARKKIGPRVEWDLALIRHWARIGGDEGEKQLGRLVTQRHQWKGPDRERFLTALVSALTTTGASWGVQEKLLEELAQEQHGNIAVLRLLCEGCYGQGYVEKVRIWADQITRVEGEGGPAGAYGEALYCLARGPDDPEKREEARQHLARAAKLQPSWAQIAVLEGEVADRQGRREEAAQKFRRAVELGEIRLPVLRRAVRLLYELRQYRDAEAMLERMPRQARLSGDLGRVSALLALSGVGEGVEPKELRQRALQTAREVARAGKDDYQDLVFLGQVAGLAGEYREAIEVLERARGHSPTVPDAWVALISVLSRTDLARAKKTLVEAEAKLPADRAGLALASCHEMVGQWKEAGQHYERALKANPDRPDVLSMVAGFLARIGKADEAEKLWRRILVHGRQVPPSLLHTTRRTLASQLARGKTWRGYKEALALIQANENEGGSLEDRHLKALVLATQPSQRHQAIRQCESLSPQSPEARPDFLLLLAWLYEMDGNWNKALTNYLAAARKETVGTRCLAALIGAYLRHNDLDNAEERLTELVRQAPEDRTTLELRARFLLGKQQFGQAIELLERASRDKKIPLEDGAALLAESGQAAVAENMYRKALTLSGRPQILLMLAQHLAQQGQIAAALAECDRAWRSCPPEDVAVTCVGIMADRRASVAQRQEVIGKVNAALASNPKSLTLLLVAGMLADQSGKPEAARGYYERLLKLQPGHTLALNNLAYIRGLRDGKHTRALEMIDQAIETDGPRVEFLDTRAMIHLAAGRPDKARKDLETAIGESNQPVLHLHLARVYLAEKNRPDAVVAFRKATELGINRTWLPMLEHSEYKRLQRELQ
jgi:tetratricopeptide (TPR) repeat protein